METIDMTKVEPKVLIISNNAFSSTNNNGKTLASFFKSFESDNIAQLYFSPDLPTDDYYKNFYQISDASIIKSIMFPKQKSGRVVKAVINNNELNKIKNNRDSIVIKQMLFNSNIARLARELIWKIGNWETAELTEWIDKLSPDIIFFCAGDSEFAYKITRTLQNKSKSKLVIYITDDYVLPRKTKNLFWWIRRNLVLMRLKPLLEISELFITISDKMSNIYSDFLFKQSFVMLNITSSLKHELNESFTKDTLNLVYAGGLHLNRHKTLILLARAIQKYNMNLNDDDKRVFLEIYSASTLNLKILDKLNISGASKFCGSLGSDELKNVLNRCDIPVHVESFDKRSIEATLLSISTKIPEYLSLEKPILAVGPYEIASMEYLEDVAFCINKPEDVFQEIQKLFRNQKLRKDLAILSREKFKSNHDLKINTALFRQELMRLNGRSH